MQIHFNGSWQSLLLIATILIIIYVPHTPLSLSPRENNGGWAQLLSYAVFIHHKAATCLYGVFIIG